MRGFWPRSSSSAPSDPIDTRDNTNAVSVKPAPVPARALSTPFPTQEVSSAISQHDDPTATTASGENTVKDNDRISLPTSALTSSPTSPSPKLEPSPLPALPFIPPPDKNPDLKGFSMFKADPSSILLHYPRSNIDRIQDFYKIYNPPERGWWSVASSVVMCSVAVVSKTFLTFGAYTAVYNLNPFLKILFDPHRTRSILTDDPLIWGALPWKCYVEPSKTTRYAIGAQELCYPNKLTGTFFRFGQIVPVIRGIGIYQPAVDKSINLLKSGRWVHIFPEGKINQTDQLIRLKWGVGRILMEHGGPSIAEGGKPMSEAEMPIVIPIYHVGMEDILRLYDDNSSPVIPKLGMPLTIVFGEPIDFGPLMKEYKEGKLQEVEARVKITKRVYEALDELKKVSHRLHAEQTEKAENDRIRKGRWWWAQAFGWGWWRSQDIDINSRYRDTTVRIQEL